MCAARADRGNRQHVGRTDNPRDRIRPQQQIAQWFHQIGLAKPHLHQMLFLNPGLIQRPAKSVITLARPVRTFKLAGHHHKRPVPLGNHRVGDVKGRLGVINTDRGDVGAFGLVK